MFSLQVIKKTTAKAVADYFNGSPAEYFDSEGGKIYSYIPQVKDHNLSRKTDAELIEFFSSRKRAGLDATYSLGKDISLLAMLYDRNVADIIREEIKRTADRLNDLVMTRESDGIERKRVRGEAFIAVYEHHTSRELDPQLHYHIYISNGVVRADGKLTALDATEIFSRNRTIMIETNFRLAKQLQALGYSAYLDESATLKILDDDKRLVELFSKRKKAILEKAKEMFGTDNLEELTREQIKRIVVATRPSKINANINDLRDAWRDDLESLGINHTSFKKSQPVRAITGKDTFDALNIAVQYLDEREGFFSADALWRNYLIALSQVARERSAELPDLSEARRAFDETVERLSYGANPELIRKEINGELYFATRDYVETLEYLKEIFKQMATTAWPWPLVENINGVVAAYEHEKGFKLSDDQRRAIEALVSDELLTIIHGHAGTGKTTVMEIFRRSMPYDIIGLAPTGKSAEELAKTLGTGETIDSFLAKSPELKKETVIVIDEAFMVDARKMEKLARYIVHNSQKIVKVVLTGDTKQLSPVQAGEPFREIIETIKKRKDNGYWQKNIVELSSIRRQRDKEYLAITTALSEGDYETAFRGISKSIDYIDERSVRETADEIIKTEAITYTEALDRAKEALTAEKVIKDFLEDPDGTLIVAPTNSLKNLLNEAIREELISQGKVSREGITIDAFQRTTSGLTTKGKHEYVAVRKTFAVGDRVVTVKNDKKFNVKNGEIFKVKAIEGTRITLTNEKKTIEIDVNEYAFLVMLTQSPFTKARV